jgi:phosphatidylglycerol lysyltransferase
VLLVALAAWALRRELAGLDAGSLVAALRGYTVQHVVVGLAATAGSFALLGAIELMALRYAGRTDIPRATGMITGFVANALSQAIGVALLTGAAVRMRAYRSHGVDTSDVARISAFVTLTVTLGLLATGAVAFLASSAPLSLWHLTLPVRAVGAVLAGMVLAYLGWSAAGHRATIGRGAWRIVKPRPALALAQTALASLDWIVTGSLLYLVLPAAAAVGYATSLRVYLVAQTLGTLSHVPGGAGVFELLVLALLAPAVATPLRAGIVASLVLFRVLYYVLPLAGACIVTGIAELRAARRPEMVHAR